ncbi:cell division protease FtsH [Agrobacterium larrymoorei]|uniref:Cell division protease FtsH n=1 Tax=Agrobacterium larrymoorei TaxID=160699 RepID=A0AAJ2BEY6_9HYPH|nr:AAA family ATPase [Agrobacterium larrymoorei]MDR6104219.1 cell division protease FtsH [Agrobacterium larrymoorei]
MSFDIPYINHDQYHRSSYDLTLPTHLAIISMSRSIRHFLKKRPSFVAAFILPVGSEIQAFRTAAKWLLDGIAKKGEEYGGNHVLTVNERKELADELTGFKRLRDLTRAIILLESRELLSNDIRIVADVVVELHPPSAKDYRIAARRMGFGNVTDADAAYLAEQSPARVALGWRRGRSVAMAVERLRRNPHMQEGDHRSDPLPPGPTLQDLSGYGGAKAWGIELAEDLALWRTGKLAWEDIDCGILLSGPPGSGKTSFASALAKTCGTPLILGSAARWQATGHLGDMLKAMRAAFAEAAEQAPSILLIDEFDSFTSRSDGTDHGDNYNRQVINALLELLDGAQSHEGVIVIGATNYADIIDPALLRAGRLERHFEIRLPDERSRTDIFRFYLRGGLSEDDLSGIVRASSGWSGADIERCVRDARRNARRAKRPLSLSDLKDAMPPTINVPMAVRRCVAAHELGHALLGVLLEADSLVSVSVEKTVPVVGGSNALGVTVFKERLLTRKTSAYVRNKIAILLGGIAAEELLFGEYGDGAGGDPSADLNRATDLATMMEIKWGLGGTLSVEPVSNPAELSEHRNRRKRLQKSVETTLQSEFRRAKSLLEEHRDALLDLHTALLREGSLSADVIRAATGLTDVDGNSVACSTAANEVSISKSQNMRTAAAISGLAPSERIERQGNWRTSEYG